MSLFGMDLQDKCSAVKSVKVNNAEIKRVPCVDASDVKDNGSCGSSDVDKLATCETTDVLAYPHDAIDEGDKIGRPGGSPTTTGQSASGLTPLTTKGYGLKTWRRIRRDVVKDGNASLDAGKILKRGFSDSGNMEKPSRGFLEIGKDSEGSVGSTSVARVTSVVEGLVLNFAAGTDSDHSEDWSSKSSTAASAPKAKYDLPGALGHARERNRAKNLSGKGLGHQGKARVDSMKNPRGERVKHHKENPRSSMESDLRSSNSVFIQGAFVTAGNGMKSRNPTSYYSGNNDGAHQSGQCGEDANASYPQDDFQDGENISQDGSSSWEDEEGKDENHRSSPDQDPLLRSMRALLAVQEALEKEVDKFSEMAMEPIDPIAEAQVSNLMENVKSLEVTLEETRMTLQARESRISELEAALSNSRSPKEESTRNDDLQLETAFKQKIEAEIEYLAIVRTIQMLWVDLQSQLMLLTEREANREQTTTQDRISEVETNAAMMEKRAKELKEACEGVAEAEDDVLKLQRGACKATSWFLLQLLLLVLVVWFLMQQLSQQKAVVVPT